MQCGGVTFDSRCKIAVSIKQMKSSCLRVIACHNNSINHLIESMKWARARERSRTKNWTNEYGSQKLAQNEFINIQRMQIPIFNCHGRVFFFSSNWHNEWSCAYHVRIQSGYYHGQWGRKLRLSKMNGSTFHSRANCLLWNFYFDTNKNRHTIFCLTFRIWIFVFVNSFASL